VGGCPGTGAYWRPMAPHRRQWRNGHQASRGTYRCIVRTPAGVNPRRGRIERMTGIGAAMMIYKLLSVEEWRTAKTAGVFRGSAVDLADGYVHFSTAEQVVETAARHFAGRLGLVLLTVDPQLLGDELRWELSRGGALFPHLYADLPVR